MGTHIVLIISHRLFFKLTQLAQGLSNTKSIATMTVNHFWSLLIKYVFDICNGASDNYIRIQVRQTSRRPHRREDECLGSKNINTETQKTARLALLTQGASYGVSHLLGRKRIKNQIALRKK